ncbi:hypothetical protein [Rhizocola hellebori]|nr:hypothetical protein [Rhizocola hellebori]
MTQAIRHYADEDNYYNGSTGRWTICGLKWFRQPAGVVADCPDCVKLRQERIDRAKAEWCGR